MGSLHSISLCLNAAATAGGMGGSGYPFSLIMVKDSQPEVFFDKFKFLSIIKQKKVGSIQVKYLVEDLKNYFTVEHELNPFKFEL